MIAQFVAKHGYLIGAALAIVGCSGLAYLLGRAGILRAASDAARVGRRLGYEAGRREGYTEGHRDGVQAATNARRPHPWAHRPPVEWPIQSLPPGADSDPTQYLGRVRGDGWPQ